MLLRKEIQDFVDEITGTTHPEEVVLVRLAHAGLELIDVVGGIVRALDKANLETDLKVLQSELIAAAEAVIDKLLGRTPVRANTAKMVVSFLVPQAVTQLGVTYSGDVEAFRVGYLLPVFRKIEEVGHRGVVAFGG